MLPDNNDQFIKFVPWKVLEIKNRRNHTEAKVPNHPKNANGWVSYGKVLMENKIERMLEPNEVVFHIDGDPFNNDINNLQLMTQAELITLVRERGKETTRKKKEAKERLQMAQS